EVGVQASGCRQCWSLALEMQGSGDNSCITCEQIDYLLNLVARLKDEVARLRDIRDCRRVTNLSNQALQAPQAEAGYSKSRGEWTQVPLKRRKVKPPCLQSPSPLPLENKVPGNGEGWIQVPARGGKRNPSRPSPPLLLPLHNKYEALQAEGSGDERAEEQPSREEPTAKCSSTTVTTSSTKTRRRVIGVGDTLVRGTEGPICRPDPSHREVCSLPGAWVRDIARRHPKSTDYYLLLVIRAGSDKIDKKATRAIKKELKALGQLIDGAGAQVVFCSVPSVAGEYTERNGRTHTSNNWLRGLCQQQNFGFSDHGTTFTAPNLLGPDGGHLSRRGKRVLALELAGLIRRALN
ncbi:hypothetical protein N307_02380, partial [Dryobates pubescens]